MYDPSKFEEFPRRSNIHDRHNRLLVNDHYDPQSHMDSFLHPMMSRDYISRIPVPHGAVEDLGLQYPWQTPSHWAYPAGVSSVERKEMAKNSSGVDPGVPPVYGFPRLADDECLRRSDILWEPHKKTKTYIKVPPLLKSINCRLVLMEITPDSPSTSVTFMSFPSRRSL